MGLLPTNGFAYFPKDIVEFTKTLYRAAEVIARGIPSLTEVCLWRPRMEGSIEWARFEVVRIAGAGGADLKIRCPPDEGARNEPPYPVVHRMSSYEVDP